MLFSIIFDSKVIEDIVKEKVRHKPDSVLLQAREKLSI